MTLHHIEEQFIREMERVFTLFHDGAYTEAWTLHDSLCRRAVYKSITSKPGYAALMIQIRAAGLPVADPKPLLKKAYQMFESLKRNHSHKKQSMNQLKNQ